MERWPPGMVVMTWRTVGSCKEGHVAVQISRQRSSSVQRRFMRDDTDAADASVAPSRRVRMCAWMMSGCRVVRLDVFLVLLFGDGEVVV